jgi:CheY-like chemotaxis protein
VPPAAPILVIDDDYDVRNGIAEVLADEGYTLATAAHGEEALRLLRDGLRPSLILLDLMMPVMDGETFCRLWHDDELLRTIPVVVLSADAAASEKTRHLGASTVLRKPVQLDDLLSVVARHASAAA